jgi:mRNA interferase RelE/StbE
MASVTYERDAAEQLAMLPTSIKRRIAAIVIRLERWPTVSGAKPLRGNLAGRYRIRTGDYRLQFRVEGDEVIIERIGHRDRFYED